MATTPVYGLRYLQLGDPPDIPALGQNLSEDVEAQISRLDDAIAVGLAGLSTATDWADYVPAVQNVGSATFSTQSGWWRRTWTKTVIYTAYFVVSANGTGTGNFGYKLPTAPYRGSANRRQAVGTGTRGDGARVKTVEAVTFAGGADEWVDRVVQDGSTTYIQGQDLDAGDIYVLSGMYREA